MPRRRPKATPDEPDATRLRGQDANGNVRPADNRYLTEAEISERDAYVEETTGEDAQQLVVKREAPEHVEQLNSRDRGE